MADVELILLQRVEKLGQMGDVVKVKPGFARNYLLPQKKALRASKDNLARFEQERAQLEAQNLKRREEAERVAERVGGLSVVIIRQAGESGSLYGSVSARDIAEATTAAGLTIDRQQVMLEHPIKTLGLARVRVALHPEVSIPVIVNVARSQEEAERQARGERVGAEAEEEEEAALDAAAMFDAGAAPEQPLGLTPRRVSLRSGGPRSVFAGQRYDHPIRHGCERLTQALQQCFDRGRPGHRRELALYRCPPSASGRRDPRRSRCGSSCSVLQVVRIEAACQLAAGFRQRRAVRDEARLAESQAFGHRQSPILVERQGRG